MPFCRAMTVTSSAGAVAVPGIRSRRKSTLNFRFQEFDDLFAHSLIANSLEGLHVVARDDLVRILDESVESRFIPGDPGAGEALRIVAVACRTPCLRAVDVMKGWAEAIVAFLGRMTSSAMSVECHLPFVRGKNVRCADECEQGGQPGVAQNDTDRGNHKWLLGSIAVKPPTQFTHATRT